VAWLGAAIGALPPLGGFDLGRRQVVGTTHGTILPDLATIQWQDGELACAKRARMVAGPGMLGGDDHSGQEGTRWISPSKWGRRTSRWFIEPSLYCFGRRRVQEALVAYLRSGTDPELVLQPVRSASSVVSRLEPSGRLSGKLPPEQLTAREVADRSVARGK
jgi:hypothetical protein